MKKKCLLAIFFVIAATDAFAYRPLGTEDAGVAGRGVAQIEVSWDYVKWENGDMENIFLFVPVYGVTNNLELSAEVPYIFHSPDSGKDEEGAGDINLVAKYLLLDEGAYTPAFTIKGVVKLDNGDYDKGLGSGDRDYSAFAVFSKTVASFAFHAHIGYARVGDRKDENLRDITLYGFAADYAMNERCHIVAEINGNRHTDRTADENPGNALVGVIYRVSDTLFLDAAVRRGLTDASPEWSTTAGISLSF